MNTIVASSKSAVRFTLNFFDKTITGTKAYPLTKKWFLGEFSDMEGGFDMEAAKKDIANYRIAKAQASILEVVSAAAAAEQNENEAA